MNLFDKLKQLFQNENNQTHAKARKGSLSFLQWMFVLIGLGLAAMILVNYYELQTSMEKQTGPPFSIVEQTEAVEAFAKSGAGPRTMDEYENWYARQLEEILGRIVGVGEVTVMINLESTEEAVIEKDIKTQHSTTNEKDREGGSRQVEDQVKDEKVVILRQGNGEQPVIIMTKKPQIRGVLVVAKGAENMQVKAWIMEAVQRVLGVPAHRVSVMPRKS